MRPRRVFPGFLVAFTRQVVSAGSFHGFHGLRCAQGWRSWSCRRGRRRRTMSLEVLVLVVAPHDEIGPNSSISRRASAKGDRPRAPARRCPPLPSWRNGAGQFAGFSSFGHRRIVERRRSMKVQSHRAQHQRPMRAASLDPAIAFLPSDFTHHEDTRTRRKIFISAKAGTHAGARIAAKWFRPSPG